MSKKVLVNLNMSKNQIENAAAHNLSSAPSSPAVGQEYFNTSDKQKYIWDGTSWVSETSQGTTYTFTTGLTTTEGSVVSVTDYDKLVKNIASNAGSIEIGGSSTNKTEAVSLGKDSSAGAGYTTAIGYKAEASGLYSTALGHKAKVTTGSNSIAIGNDAVASAANAIQIGKGTISTEKTLSIGFGDSNYALLNGNTGKIPDERLSTVIARTTDIGDGATVFKKNGTAIGTITANQTSPVDIDYTIPTTATEVGALPSSTKYGATFVASLNTTDYKLTMTLKDQDGNTLGTSQVVDFPVESVVVGGSYDNTNKKIILTLQNGNTIDVPVGDLVAGLQSEITSTNKLSADLVDDSTTTNKFVTAANKTTWNNKQNAISDLATIRSGASAGATAAQTYTTTNPALTQTGGVCTWTVTHNLGANVVASVYDATTNEEVIVTIEKISNTVATVKMNSASNIASGAYRVVVIGK